MPCCDRTSLLQQKSLISADKKIKSEENFTEYLKCPIKGVIPFENDKKLDNEQASKKATTEQQEGVAPMKEDNADYIFDKGTLTSVPSFVEQAVNMEVKKNGSNDSNESNESNDSMDRMRAGSSLFPIEIQSESRLQSSPEPSDDEFPGPMFEGTLTSVSSSMEQAVNMKGKANNANDSMGRMRAGSSLFPIEIIDV